MKAWIARWWNDCGTTATTFLYVAELAPSMADEEALQQANDRGACSSRRTKKMVR